MMRGWSLVVAVHLGAGGVFAQAWQLLSTRGLTECSVYDAVRDRVVTFVHAADGPRLLEWDGHGWLSTHPTSGIGGPSTRVARAVFDTARGRTLVLFDGSLWSWDGVDWRHVQSGAPGRLDTNQNVHAWDAPRRVFVYRDAIAQTTHEWDGTQWRSVAGPIGNVASWYPCLGFDPVRQQVIATIPGVFRGAFAWDGQTWNHLPTATLPAGMPEREMAVCTDPARNRLLMFGGATGSGVADTLWEWSGNGWTAIASGPRRQRAALAPHAGTGTLVLHGGNDGAFVTMDTWAFDTSFRLVEAAPPCLARAVTDPVRRRMVGIDCAQPGTWEADGATWVRVGTSPALSDLVYDATRGVVLGIQNDISLPALRTWAWTGSGWQMVAATSPPWQRMQGLCHDPSRQVVVLVGMQGTWEWNGLAWQPRSPAHHPAVPWNATMASAVFDPLAQRVRLLMSGSSGNEEWEWDGTDWARATTTGLPGAQYGALAFDPSAGRVVFAGSDANGGNAGTWERSGNAWIRIDDRAAYPRTIAPDPFTRVLKSWQQGTWYALRADAASVVRYGTGCGVGSPPTLTAVGRPTPIGDDLRLDLGAAPAMGLAAVYASLTSGSTALGNGCTLLLGSLEHFAGLVTDVQGVASLPVPVPDQPALIGLDVAWQAAVLQPGGPLSGVAALTNAVRTHIGH